MKKRTKADKKPRSARFDEDEMVLIEQELSELRRMTGENQTFSEYVRRALNVYRSIPLELRDKAPAILEAASKSQCRAMDITLGIYDGKGGPCNYSKLLANKAEMDAIKGLSENLQKRSDGGSSGKLKSSRS